MAAATSWRNRGPLDPPAQPTAIEVRQSAPLGPRRWFADGRPPPRAAGCALRWTHARSIRPRAWSGGIARAPREILPGGEDLDLSGYYFGSLIIGSFQDVIG